MRRADPEKACRVSIETRKYLEQQAQHEQYADAFDPWNDAVMEAICGRFAPAMQELLIKLDQIDKTNASFGADKEKSLDFLLPTLHKLRDQCREEFKNV